MHIFTSLALFGLALVCGCSPGKHYVRGQGDVGQFIIQHAVAFGGHPAATNGLPTITGDWQYIQDEYGVGICFPSRSISQFRILCVPHLGRRRIQQAGQFEILVLRLGFRRQIAIR